MEHQARISNKPKNYAKISLNKRIKLVQLVTQKPLSIAKASAKLGIRPSTAKLILKKYRQQGGYFEKRSDKLARLAFMKQSQQASPLTPPQQVPFQLQNAFENGISFPTVQLEYGVYLNGAGALFGMGEWNGGQNLFFGSFLNSSWMQCAPSPFYF